MFGGAKGLFETWGAILADSQQTAGKASALFPMQVIETLADGFSDYLCLAFALELREFPDEAKRLAVLDADAHLISTVT